jgi:hypothetical protein
VIEQRRGQDAGNDGHRAAEAGGQQEGQQLGLVAHFGQRHNAG